MPTPKRTPVPPPKDDAEATARKAAVEYVTRFVQGFCDFAYATRSDMPGRRDFTNATDGWHYLVQFATDRPDWALEIVKDLPAPADYLGIANIIEAKDREIARLRENVKKADDRYYEARDKLSKTEQSREDAVTGRALVLVERAVESLMTKRAGNKSVVETWALNEVCRIARDALPNSAVDPRNNLCRALKELGQEPAEGVAGSAEDEEFVLTRKLVALAQKLVPFTPTPEQAFAAVEGAVKANAELRVKVVDLTEKVEQATPIIVKAQKQLKAMAAAVRVLANMVRIGTKVMDKTGTFEERGRRIESFGDECKSALGLVQEGITYAEQHE